MSGSDHVQGTVNNICGRLLYASQNFYGHVPVTKFVSEHENGV